MSAYKFDDGAFRPKRVGNVIEVDFRPKCKECSGDGEVEALLLAPRKPGRRPAKRPPEGIVQIVACPWCGGSGVAVKP